MSIVPTLSPEQEQQVVEGITAIDWTPHYEAARRAVVETLHITDREAEQIVEQLSNRRIIRLSMQANNFGETGLVRVAPVKWVRAGIPTTMELIHQLMAMKGFVSLDRSRQVVAEFCGCSTDEANHLLHELRDKNILTLLGSGMDWRWGKPDEAS